MKDRPILFSGPMVQALLDGRKTQTRRIVKWPDWVTETGKLKLALQRPATGLAYYVDGHPVKRFACPYGIPGDRMWVREAHCIGIPGLPNGMGIVPIKSEAIKPGMKVVYKEGSNYGGDPPPWRPSIHMPRWACRTVLEITEIRVQRLQEITPDDARAEGCDDEMCAKGAFEELWKSINGAGSWAANPWVWCVSFKKVQP